MRHIRYIYELPDWPQFRWNSEDLADVLSRLYRRRERLLRRMGGLGFSLRQEVVRDALTEEIVKSSAIEGEVLDLAQVRSSVARRLGVDAGGVQVHPTRQVEGIAEIMLDATMSYDAPLTAERLFGWHAALFPTGRSGMHRIRAGAWRTDERGRMQVVSGPPGREQVHYQAPEASRVQREMWTFLGWFNEQPEDDDPIIKAAIAHLWFVTIHPFDDGNGRIARAIGELALARSERSPSRFYSVSSQIVAERSSYYDILESTQRGSMDVTRWLAWFIDCMERAIEHSESLARTVLEKARFWQGLEGVALNDRQRLMLGRLLDGVEGNLTTSKWAKLTKCSTDAALRDINELIAEGILIRNLGGGRSTSYALVRR